MDLMLPDLDGFEAIRLLREQAETRDTPVVVLSAIEVEPNDPRALGATVCLTKPFSSADLLGAIRSTPAGSERRRRVTAARILVVDDEADISTILTVTLRRAGYEVASAADGIEAVEAIHRQAPDLILLDVMMPRADGLETLKRIRQHAPTAQRAGHHAHRAGRLADKMKGFERGADDYVAKPFEPAEIVVRVAALLKRSTHSRVVSPLLSVLGDWFITERMAQLGRDLEAARDIQERLLPPVPPTVAGLEAGAMLRSVHRGRRRLLRHGADGRAAARSRSATCRARASRPRSSW